MQNHSETDQGLSSSKSDDKTSNIGMHLLTWLIILTVIGYFGFIALTTRTLREQRISVSEVLGRELPGEYMDSLTLRTDEGKVSQFFLPDKNLKFSIAFSQNQDRQDQDQADTGNLPLNMTSPYQFIKDYVSTGSIISGTEGAKNAPTFLLNFAKGQFNFLRAKFISTDIVTWKGSQIVTDSVSVKDEQFYRLGFLRNDRGSFLVVAFTMDKEIKKEDFEAAIALVN